MKISIILGHPRRGSFNHAIAERVIQTLENNDHEVIYHDLYDERFDPILPAEEIPKEYVPKNDLQQYCTEIALSEGIIVIHPNWWGQPPAILKGWVDRVMRPGTAYEFAEGDRGEGIPIGLLRAQAALVFNTSNTPEKREMAAFGDPLEIIWRRCIFDLCGVKNFKRRTYGVIVTSTSEQREFWLGDVQNMVNETFPDQNQRRNRQGC
jgi:NAD(P)H dehydrogenase (quinone)